MMRVGMKKVAKKIVGGGLSSMSSKLTANGWVYEKVCLDELSNYYQTL